MGPQGVAEAEKWGADTGRDYTRQDIQQLTQRFDVVVDLSTKLSFKAAKKLMKSRSVYITTLPSPLMLVYFFFHNLFSGRKLRILIVKPSGEGLHTLAALAEKGLQIVLAKTYSINHVREAYREARRGKILGKSVIVLD